VKTFRVVIIVLLIVCAVLAIAVASLSETTVATLPRPLQSACSLLMTQAREMIQRADVLWHSTL
jgi:hypothetical protein